MKGYMTVQEAFTAVAKERDQLRAEIKDLKITHRIEIRQLTNKIWIPVTERLPEPFERVFVCWPRKGVDYAEEGMLLDNGWWQVYGLRTKGVTHWMPLPALPEGPAV